MLEEGLTCHHSLLNLQSRFQQISKSVLYQSNVIVKPESKAPTQVQLSP